MYYIGLFFLLGLACVVLSLKRRTCIHTTVSVQGGHKMDK
jgi:hypothetical protein